MYPIKFENLYYERIWGGRKLADFRDNLPEGVIGESWDIACHNNGMGIVSNGKFKGASFKELIDKYKEKLVGTKINTNKFPLLIKIITADEKLSVQVHPNDEYAARVENELGKTEAWYVMDADEDAKLIVGTKDCTKELFEKAIKEEKLDKYLNVINVKKGDMYYIKSGLIHAICGGVTIAEIQQSSDTTYRVYDYGRGREIHVDKALDVIDFNLKGENNKGITINYDDYKNTILCLSEYFTIQKYSIDKKMTEESDEERFYLFTCVEGKGKIISKDCELEINYGDSIFIPATMGEYTLEGKMELLKSYVPNLKREEKKIISKILY